jgi:EAL domain-containing protein (putative c-di-GMP-specific phosphodiesterase class I)
MGGDEFIFILRNINRAQEAVTVAKRLLGALEAPIHFGGHELIVAASIGIALPTANSDASTLLRDADTAMYRAKQGGGDRYSIFDHNLHLRSVRRLALEGELRHALAKHEFEVYYQPVVRTHTRRPVSAEALVRWRHPTRGLVSPDEFISIADESGLIKPLGRWVFDKALSQLAEWDGNVDGPRLDVLAVNFSARQLDDPETSGEVRAALERHQTDPARICVEITESLLIDDGAAIRRTLGRLAALGLRIAIDDFGTGYSSLSNLHRLPISTVKIDRSFVEAIDSDDDSTPLIQAIVEMSHALGLRVVAEGVSSARLDDCVASLGCDLAQGFYWAQPMPATEFLAWWKEAQPKTASLVSVA